MEQRRSSFRASRALEMEFRRRLRQVAQEIRRMTAAGQRETAVIEQLRQYGRQIGPWSRTVAENIVLKANRMNLREWNAMARHMHRALAAEYSSGSRVAARTVSSRLLESCRRRDDTTRRISPPRGRRPGSDGIPGRC